MTSRIRRNQAQWEELVEEQVSSGINAAMFCRQRSLCRKTFYYQRKIMNENSTSLVASRFIQVQSSSDRAPQVPQPLMTVLDYRQIRSQIPDDIDLAWVAELLQALP
jgi:hypothetical protein